MVTTLHSDIFQNQDRNTLPTEGERHLLITLDTALKAGYLQGWKVYEQPHLNGERPDFVMANPNWGVIIIEVKDWDIDNTSRWQEGGNFIDDCGHPHSKRSPIAQVKGYKDNILKMYSRKFLDLLDSHTDGWAVIETAVYFHHGSMERGEALFGRDKHTSVLDRSHLCALAKGQLAECGLKTLKYFQKNRNDVSQFAKGTPNRLKIFIDDLEPWLHQTDNRVNLRPISLTPEQARQAEPTPGLRRRLKGAAGSGKSLVLATRAAKLLAQGKRVLVLSYNITLQHYLRDLVNLQYDGSLPGATKKSLVVFHFHKFLRWVADTHEVELPTLEGLPEARLTQVLEDEWPKAIEQNVVKAGKPIEKDCLFDAILIDEGQDFNRKWLLLLTHFYRPGQSELLIAYDDAQNLYQRTLTWLDTGGDVKDLGFKGKPAELKHSQRLPNTMAALARAFARQYIDPNLEPIELSPQPELFKHFLSWNNQIPDQAKTLPNVIAHFQEVVAAEMRAHRNDITILVENHDLALKVVEALMERGLRVTHVFDLSGERDHERRREEKWRFQPTTGTIKVCTVHSFKGWESPYVIAIIGHPEQVAREARVSRALLIYVALTRLKRNEDGSNLCVFYNFDPRFNDVQELFKAMYKGQGELELAARKHAQG